MPNTSFFDEAENTQSLNLINKSQRSLEANTLRKFFIIKGTITRNLIDKYCGLPSIEPRSMDTTFFSLVFN